MPYRRYDKDGNQLPTSYDPGEITVIPWDFEKGGPKMPENDLQRRLWQEVLAELVYCSVLRTENLEGNTEHQRKNAQRFRDLLTEIDNNPDFGVEKDVPVTPPGRFTEAYCTECGKELTLQTGEADELWIRMKVEPCPTCLKKAVESVLKPPEAKWTCRDCQSCGLGAGNVKHCQYCGKTDLNAAKAFQESCKILDEEPRKPAYASVNDLSKCPKCDAKPNLERWWSSKPDGGLEFSRYRVVCQSDHTPEIVATPWHEDINEVCRMWNEWDMKPYFFMWPDKVQWPPEPIGGPQI
jgi:hypothetical protein